MEDVSTPRSQPGKTGFASKCLQLLSRNKYTAENPQLRSPLFTKLPQEIRDQIWKVAFEPPKDSKPAHFHIYDEVYDACTYQRPSSDESHSRAERRKAQSHIAMLMSCRMIYREALPFLYDQNHFTFVVFAGLPRGCCDHSRSRKSLGKLKDCEKLFQRIRKLTIIIQPGKRPHLELYTKRLQDLLRTLEYGKHLRDLTLLFNYHIEITTLDILHETRRQIAAALHPLQQQLAAKFRANKCRVTIMCWLAEVNSEPVAAIRDSKYLKLLETICSDDTTTALGYQRKWDIGQEHTSTQAAIIQWRPLRADDRRLLQHFGADLDCLERGAFGNDYAALKRNQPQPRTPAGIPFLPNVTKEQVQSTIIIAGFLVLAPISLPWTTYAMVNRKKVKGEWKSRLGK